MSSTETLAEPTFIPMFADTTRGGAGNDHNIEAIGAHLQDVPAEYLTGA